MIGDAKIEMNDGGQKVTAYASAGVEMKSAGGKTNEKSAQLGVSADFKTVVVNGVTVEKAADGHMVISAPGTVLTKPAPANDSVRSSTSLQTGDVETDGEHKGEIYGGIYPADNKPIWFSQPAPKLMDHHAAAAWAKEQGGALPTRKQGHYLDTIKDKGAFKTLFNRSRSYPPGSVVGGTCHEHQGRLRPVPEAQRRRPEQHPLPEPTTAGPVCPEMSHFVITPSGFLESQHARSAAFF